jgi:hypothetical protein
MRNDNDTGFTSPRFCSTILSIPSFPTGETLLAEHPHPAQLFPENTDSNATEKTIKIILKRTNILLSLKQFAAILLSYKAKR